MHLTLADLYAYRDHELEGATRAHCAAHLADCPACRQQLAQAQASGVQVQARLAPLATTDPAPATGPAWAQFQTRIRTHSTQEWWNMLKKLFAQRSVWVGAAIALILVIAFSFAPVRAWAGQFLGIFRVQQITVLPLDPTRFSQVSSDRSLAEQMSQLFAEAVKVTREPADPQHAASAADASALAGFAVRLPADTPTQITVQSGGAFEIVIDRDRAQGLLNDMGRSDLQLPKSVDGATVSVDLPTSVVAAFGTCPAPDAAEPEERGPDNWRVYRDCQIFAQMPSPTVTTPPDLDVTQLAELGLQLAGLTPAEAHAFSARVDWTTTLVVPFPSDAGHYEEVLVDGVSGTLMYYGDPNQTQRYTLLWVKDGLIYALNGYGTPAQATQWASTLK